MGEHTQKVPGVGMTGINLQNLPVQPLRFVQPPGLMMSQGDGEHLLHARRRILRHKSILARP